MAPAADPTSTVHTLVSLRARDGWQRYADENGVSLSSLIEALGQQLADLEPDEVESLRADWVHAARQVGVVRRRRGQQTPSAG